MKKTFQLRDLDCANCAAKMEDAIQRIDGVHSATISFLTQTVSYTHLDVYKRQVRTR